MQTWKQMWQRSRCRPQPALHPRGPLRRHLLRRLSEVRSLAFSREADWLNMAFTFTYQLSQEL